MSATLLNPNGALAERRILDLRVERQPAPPRLWRWVACAGGSARAIRCSEASFRCAQDAWEAGQRALGRL